MKNFSTRLLTLVLLLVYLEQSFGVEFEKLGTAVSKALSGARHVATAKKAFKTEVELDGKRFPAFYVKGAKGKAQTFAFVQKGIYEPDCTHTWVVGVDAASAKVQDIEVVEMSCPHGFPTNRASFLEQFKGKGPADVKGLKDKVHTIAKATGSSDLTTDAVSRSIRAAIKLKGKI